MNPENVCDRLAAKDHLGLAVAITKHGNKHVGIVFNWREQAYLYHQALHLITLGGRFDDEVKRIGGATKVVKLTFALARQKAVAGFFDSMMRKGRPYPYALKYDKHARIHPELGTLITEGVGLSCVTFVLAMFQSNQLTLINAATWPPARPDDLEEQEALLKLLDKSSANDAHKELVRKEKGCVRVRPNELGAVGYFARIPVVFTQAEPASIDLLAKIQAIMPTTTPADPPPDLTGDPTSPVAKPSG